MEYTYKGLTIDLPYEIEEIDALSITEAVNEHIHVKISMLAQEDKIEEYLTRSTENSKIVIYQYDEEEKKNKDLFHGLISSLKVVCSNKLNILELEAVSFTYQWDIDKKSRTFQNLDMTYKNLIDEVLKSYAKSDCLDSATEGETIGDIIIQYEETDWQFLKRIATHFETVILPEGTIDFGRIYFGMPKYGTDKVLEEKNYEIVKDLEGYSKDYFDFEQDSIRWVVQSRNKLRLGERVKWQDTACQVGKVVLSNVKDELMYTYTLVPSDSTKTKMQYNSSIGGMSLSAVIKEVKGNSVRVHFNIDHKYNKGDNNKFFAYALGSSAWYCMPLKNSKVNIYFQSADETDAIAANAIRSYDNVSKIGNPKSKSFSNDTGSEMVMDGEGMNYSTGGVSIRLNKSGNIEITGRSIFINADGNLQFGNKDGDGGENFVKPKKISFSSKEGIYLSKSPDGNIDPSHAIAMEDRVNLIGKNIINTASVKNPPAVSFDDSALIAQDKQLMQQVNAQAQAQLQQKLDEGKSKFGFGAIAMAVGAAALLAAATVLTGGAALAIAVAAGTTAMAVGASEMSEGSSDYTKAQSGDMSKSYNFMRDTVCGGNETLYNIIKYGSVCISAGIALFAFGGAGALAKALIDGGFRTGMNLISDLLDDGKINRGWEFYVKDVTLSMATAVFTVKFNNLMSASELNCAQKFFGNTLIDTLSDIIYQFGCGDDITLLKDFLSSAFANFIFSGDPVNVATGSLFIPATDLVFSDLHGEWKLDRQYNSVSKRRGLMGRGWTFSYESRLQRKEDIINMLCIDGHVESFKEQAGIWVNEKGSRSYELKYDEDFNEWHCYYQPEKLKYVYNSIGLLIQIIDKNNNKLSIDYDGEDIKTLTTFSGHVLKFTCSEGKIIQIEDAIGRKVQYRYDGDYLTHVNHVNHGITEYTYDDRGYITAIKDQNGNTYTKNRFDDRGRVVYQEYSDGSGCEITYEDHKRESTFYFTGSERVERYRYNEKNLVTHTFYEDDTFTEYEYDEWQNRIVETDRLGNSIRRTYNEYGNIVSEQYSNGLVYTFTYDECQNLLMKEDNAGGEILYSYDSKGNVTEERVRIEKGKWKTTRYEYDQPGRIIKSEDPLENAITFQYSHKELILPDASQIRDAEENTYIYEYDKAGRNIAITTDYGTAEFGYNSLNYATFIKDGNGNVTRKVYDKMGNLIRITLPNGYKEVYDSGKAYSCSYDFMDRLVEIRDPLGNIRKNIRDSEGNIVKEINPNYYDYETGDGLGIEYAYDKDNRKIKTIYPDGGIERLFYDANGNIIKKVTPEYYNPAKDDGEGYCYSYDSQNRLTSIINPDGIIEKRYKYDLKGNLIEEIDAKGYSTYYKYNLIGQVVEKREPVEEKDGVLYSLTIFVYDAAGNKLTERRGKDFVGLKEYSKNYHEIHFSYDKNNRLTEVRDNYGAKINYKYDCLNNKIYECARINENNSRKIYYKYDGAGNLIEKQELINGKDTGTDKDGRALWATTKFTYDNNGNIIAIKTPKGHTVKRGYDDIDRLISEEQKDDENGICRKNVYSYDKIGNVIEIKDTNNNIKAYRYDSKNRLTHFINENGDTTRLFYDKNDRVIKEVLPEQYDPSADDGQGITVAYDYYDRMLEVRNALGELTQRNVYDILGNLKSTIDGVGQKIDFTYDIVGKMKEIITPNSREQGKAAQRYLYDARGNITGIYDGNGNKTQYKMDDWGRITEIIHPDGAVEQYSYDYAGNITSTRDGNGNVITYSYNSLNKLSEIKDQEGYSECFYYDEEGNQIQSIDRNGNHLYYGYNIDKNLVFRRDKSGKLWERFGYNKDGTLSSARALGMAYSYSYTKDQKLQSKATSGRTLLSYQYDKNGNTTIIKDISGKAARYKYDAANRVTEVYDKNKTLAVYSYNADDTIEAIRYGNGVTTNYTYDGDKNIKSLITVTSKGQVLLDYNYAYDLNGNRLYKVGSKQQTYYTYDSMNRLASAKYNTGSRLLEEAFSYDKAGNRLTKASNNGIERYKYNAKNQLAELEKASGITQFLYDKQGNLTQEQHPEGITSYAYNSFNQTIKAVTKEGNTLVSRYDAEGLRAEIEENGRLTRFIFHKENIAAELNENFKITSRFSRGYEIVSGEINGKTYFYQQDEQGSTTHITSETEDVENSYFYDAFGVVLESVENVPNRITYTGQQYDAVTQQYYLRARNYNPVVARFTQEDVYKGDGLSLYIYCSNNPVAYFDPSGFMACLPGGKKANTFSNSGRNLPSSYYSYNELRKLIKQLKLSGRGIGFEAHHLLEKQFARIFGVNKGDIISVALTPLWHRSVGSLTGNNLDHLITSELDKILTKSGLSQASIKEIWEAHRNVYKKIGRLDWAEAIYEAYVKKFNIPY